MLRDILSIGDKIDLKRLDRNNKPVHNARTFVSQLIDFVDYDVLHIAAPIELGKIIILEVGENYNLCFYSEKGLYQCNCTVLSNHRDNNTIVSVVRVAGKLEKVQRRQYYRLECIHEMEYRIITKEEEILDRKLHLEEYRNQEEKAEIRRKLSKLDQLWIKGAITDISGGGARFSSTELHKKGEKIRIKIDLLLQGQLRKMVLNADIIASSRIVTRTSVYEHRVAFNDITQKDREDLIKYIFEQERKRRKSDKL